MLRRVAVVPDSGDAADGKPRGGAAAFLKLPRLLVGLAAAAWPCECDSPARSPTSPLDLRAFAALGGGGGPLLRSPRSWDARRAGLGGLIDDGFAEPGAAKNRLLVPQMRPTKPRACCPVQPRVAAAGMSVPCSRFYGDVKSGPEATVSGGAHLGVAAAAAATGSLPASIGCPPPPRYIGSVSATEVEQSEDYTRIIARGPNPKTTHIFGDCILEPCTESYWLVKLSDSGDELRRLCSSLSPDLFTGWQRGRGGEADEPPSSSSPSSAGLRGGAWWSSSRRGRDLGGKGELLSPAAASRAAPLSGRPLLLCLVMEKAARRGPARARYRVE